MADDHTLVVVGGGCIGTTIARELAVDHDVILFEKNQIAGETTGHASGIIQPQYQFPHLPKAGRLAFNFFEGLNGHRNYQYTERELINLHGPEETEIVQEYTDLVSAGQGYEATWLSAEEIEQRYPDVFNTDEDSPIAGGMLYGRMGWVDPYTFTTMMSQDAEERGAQIETGVVVTDVLVEDDEVVGVETETGNIEADKVVAAAGRWTPKLLEEHIEIPIQPERFWHINLDSGSDINDRVSEQYPQFYMDLDLSEEYGTIGIDGHLATFWRPEHTGELHVAGISGLLSEEPSVKHSVDEKFHLLLADCVPLLMDEFDDTVVTNEGCCPTGDAMSPDWLPIIDAPADAPDGLVIATGFSGLGLTASPVAAAAVRELISGYGAPFSLESFSLDRFDNCSTDFPEPPFSAFDTSIFTEAD